MSTQDLKKAAVVRTVKVVAVNVVSVVVSLAVGICIGYTVKSLVGRPIVSAAVASAPVPRPTATPDAATCLKQAQASGYSQALDAVARKWDDAAKLASATPRIALTGPLADLMAVRRELEALTPPSCAQAQQDALVAYQNAILDAFVSFMAQDSDATVAAKFDAAKLLAQAWGALFDQTFGTSIGTSFYSG